MLTTLFGGEEESIDEDEPGQSQTLRSLYDEYRAPL